MTGRLRFDQPKGPQNPEGDRRRAAFSRLINPRRDLKTSMDAKRELLSHGLRVNIDRAIPVFNPEAARTAFDWYITAVDNFDRPAQKAADERLECLGVRVALVSPRAVRGAEG
jgi:hypothetical protein